MIRRVSRSAMIALFAVIVACSDDPVSAREPDMSGGWQATLGCIPTNCTQRFWAKATQQASSGVARYDVADTVYRGNGTIFETRTGEMSVYNRHVLISYSVVGTNFLTWSLAGDVPIGDASEFSATETFVSRTTSQPVTQGPWTFRKFR